ncbi:MAG: hypothetical protein KIT17_00635 [Rubrivivax sp.]|nr:hypothetical protein [Rubrivivax sp.]
MSAPKSKSAASSAARARTQGPTHGPAELFRADKERHRWRLTDLQTVLDAIAQLAVPPAAAVVRDREGCPDAALVAVARETEVALHLALASLITPDGLARLAAGRPDGPIWLDDVRESALAAAYEARAEVDVAEQMAALGRAAKIKAEAAARKAAAGPGETSASRR